MTGFVSQVHSRGIGAEFAANASSIRPGRYEGGNHMLALHLRVDQQLGVISADVFRRAGDDRHFVASFRTTPGQTVDLDAGRFVIVGEDEQGQIAKGVLALRLVESVEATLTGSIEFESLLQGLPVNDRAVFAVQFKSPFFRKVGIEIEVERGATWMPEAQIKGRMISLRSTYGEAGYEIVEAGQQSEIPNNPNGWSEAQLHTLMQDYAQASLERRCWEAHLLVLGKSTRPGLMGVMFDSQDTVPRQGAAIFTDAIRSCYPGEQTPAALMFTAIHELGHAFNLVHRFERAVGRQDSLSVMTYPQLHLRGEDAFWRDFAYRFDEDELEFLRHGPYAKVIPGGQAFHSVRYWTESRGTYHPYLPEVPIADLRLELTPPPDRVFNFGQQVFLQIALTNTGNGPVDLPKNILDPKGQLLEFYIQRVDGRSNAGPALTDENRFTPVVQRDFSGDDEGIIRLAPGETYKNNTQLTYGSSGFTFAEPGQYEVTAVLALFLGNIQAIAKSEPTRIRVAHPQSRDEEKDSFVLHRGDVGLYFTMGGCDGLDRAEDSLEELRQKRLRASGGAFDPVVANIIRCFGIHEGRDTHRLRQGRVVSTSADPIKAADYLLQLDGQWLTAFDPHTATATKALAQKYASFRGSRRQ